MRCARRLFVVLMTLLMFAAVPGIGAGTAGAEKYDPYRPVKVESYTWGDFDEIRIMRTYQLSPVDDPAGIPTKDFEDGGWVYHMVEMTSEEQVGTDTRTITRTVTQSSDTDDTKKILKSLEAEIPVMTEDGYSGVLRLDHTSVTVDAAGFATRDNEIVTTRFFPDLDDADLSLIPKTIEDGGRMLTLDDVQWENAWQTDAEGAFIRYSATATYVGTASSSFATGYTVTADYTGEVSRSDVEMVTWKVVFAPVREAERVESPPKPKEKEDTQAAASTEKAMDSASEESAPFTENPASTETAEDAASTETAENAAVSSDGTENAAAGTDGTENAAVSSDGAKNAATETDGTENAAAETGGAGIPSTETGGAESGSTEPSASGSTDAGGREPVPESGQTTQLVHPQTSRTTPDYSGLKRTLLRCGLLIALAVTAYLLSKYKRGKGGNAS